MKHTSSDDTEFIIFNQITFKEQLTTQAGKIRNLSF